jgi:ParB-like chromosome segregation protein Spo0J
VPEYQSVYITLPHLALPRDRSRSLQPDKVEAIAASMKAVGQLQCIVVRDPGEAAGALLVICGAHRYEAAKLLNWDGLHCLVLPADTTDEKAELIELDENLARAELGEAEKTGLTMRRKELYDKLHPETTKRGGDHSSAKAKAKARREPKPKTFAEDAAKKTGEGKSTIKKRVARGKKLGKQTLIDISGTSLDSAGEMEALTELSPSQQQKIVADAKAGKRVSAKALVAAADDVKAKADAAERRVSDAVKSKLPPLLAATVMIGEALQADKSTTKPTVLAAPEKDEKAAQEEARELWVRRLNAFAEETGRAFRKDHEPFAVAPATFQNMTYLRVVLDGFIKMRAQRTETTH